MWTASIRRPPISSRLAECQRKLGAPRAGLFVHVAVGPGDRLEALVRNRIAADDGLAVGPILQPLLGPLDLVEVAAELLEESLVGTGAVEVVRLVAAVLHLIARVGLFVLAELLLDPGPLLGEP